MASADNPDDMPLDDISDDASAFDSDEGEVDDGAPIAGKRPWTRKKRWQLSIILCILIAIALGLAWVNRKEIADDYIVQQLEALDLEAQYDIAEIGPDRQVLRNVVIGDPERPDLTIEEVSVAIAFSDLVPTIGQIAVVSPRLYGSYRDGNLSFGKLDPLLFTESEEPFALPDYDIAVVDGRALMESDFGDIGLKLEGKGQISDGFAGVIAVNAPDIALEGCSVRDATVYGDIAISGGSPSFSGPVRLDALKCAAQSLALSDLNADIDIVMPSDFTSADAKGSLTLADANYAGNRSRKTSGDFTAGWDGAAEDGEGLTNVKFALASDALSAPQLSIANFSVDGAVRVRGAFVRTELDADIAGNNLRAGEGAIAALAGYQSASEGTLGAPLIAKLRRGLAKLGKANRLVASVTAKQTGSVVTAIIPEARLTNSAGEAALAVSQVQYRSGASVGAQLSGNFVTSGQDLPQMRGRMEQNGSGALALRAQMDEFREGEAAIALPQMQVQQTRGGAIQFDGRMIASGAIPGGMMRDLNLPVQGDYSTGGVLTMGRNCTDVSFAALTLDSADLVLDRRNIRMCPKGGAPLLTYGNGGLKFGAQLPALAVQGQYGGENFAVSARSALIDVSAGSGSRGLALSGDLSGLRLKGSFAGVPVNAQSGKARFAMQGTPGAPGFALTSDISGLDMTGSFGSTPFALTTGAADFGWPNASGGQGTLRNAELVIGSGDAPNLFTIAEITADLGAGTGGKFAGAEVRLDALPMDIIQGSGSWRFNDGILDLADAGFLIFDRNGSELDRFEPLYGRDAALTLDGSDIKAAANMIHPASNRKIAAVDISHDLGSAAGNAKLLVEQLQFGGSFQPQPNSNDCYDAADVPRSDPERQSAGLSCLVLGFMSNVSGPVSGTGQFDWDADGVESSGSFSLQGLDFFAAFGPVQGVKGTVNFTDLISLTTAPNQTVTLASVNPGIEVLAGEVIFEVRDAQVIDLKEARWPFMGGTLLMKPVVLDFSQSEERAYVFQMDGLDSASFVAQMELANFSATGKFDGAVPIIFDKDGNGRIEGSVLTAQPPGGNVSYVGALTYEDMGFVSNFAFNMLKSIDYTGMKVAIDGPLSGILATKLEIDGVQQGTGASRNILTREIAKLPVKLNVNVNAPLQELFAVLRPVYLPEEFDVELFKALNGSPPEPLPKPLDEKAPDLDLAPPRQIDKKKPDIQLQESETKP